MPLVRFEVRNEYRLGQPQLYDETSREDPKAVLDGIAVAGLVGILRQLGDLAEFAGEVFHGLQEQVTSTASRSHKLLVRVQNIEAALPSLEKAVLAQNSHIHFAYTAGSEWRARIQNGQNHFIYNDLPRFIMDSYEECRDPPRLHLLDKFDTGGPGSCLRRYSDPTFFRKASDNFNEPNIEKVPKEKKARKNKKKRLSQRNVDFLHSASMPNRSSRMAFSTPIDNGHTSSHTTSTTDIAAKSDMGYHTNSFDSRTGSDYVDRVFRSNSTAKPEDRESEEFSSSFMHHNNVADSVLSNEQPSIATDDFPRNSSPEPNAAPGSSCGTWDEKAEIIEPKGLNFDGSEVPEIVTADYDLETQNGDILNVNNPAQMELEYDIENMGRASIGRNDFDEVESETDNFMDALNTIESESENDLDFQTKHELEQFSAIVDDESVETELSKDRENVSEDHPSKLDTHILPYISLDKEIVTDLPDIPSESAVHEHNSPISEEVSDSENLPDIESSKNPDDSKRESLISEPLSSGYTGIESSTSPDVLGSSKVESIICEPLSSGYTGIGDSASPDALGSSKIESVIGEPSSSGYTGFGDSVSPDALGSSKVEPIISEPSSSGYTGLGDSPSPDALGSSKVESIISEPSSGYAGIGDSASQDAVRSSKVESIISEPSSSSAFGISNLGEQNTVSNSCNYEKAEISSVYPVSFWTNGGLLGLQPSKPPDFSIPRTAGQDPSASIVEVPGNGGNNPGSMESIPSSQYKGQDAEVDFHQSNRVSNVNGSLGKSSTAKPMPLDTDIKAASTGNSRENDEHSTETIGLGHRLLLNGFRRKLTLVPDGKTEEAISSALEPKIFGETNGFKPSFNSLTSSPPLDHMKISFHPVDGFEASKLNLKFPDSRDMFPSFQLVPEPGFSVQDVGFDSDDDTFCRSSPDISDDCVSRRSDSDSEQWESGESPENKDHKLYEEPSLSSSVLDLPSFDAVNPGLQGKQQKNVDQEDFKELQRQEIKPPPPLPPPPVQRRLTKSTSTVEEDKQNITSGAHVRTADLNVRGSTVYQQPKPATAIYRQVNEAAIAFRLKAKLNVQKEANQTTNDKGMDEKDDFLNQIRTKSFTLRRTVTAKANFSSGPAANGKVTAILEKANAIRQAVGSDDGEDDSWSDT